MLEAYGFGCELRSRVQMNFGLEVSALCNPAFCSVTASGPFPPGGTRFFCFAFSAPSGLGSPATSLRTPGRERRTNFLRAPPRMQTFGTWSRAHSLGSAQGDPSNNG